MQVFNKLRISTFPVNQEVDNMLHGSGVDKGTQGAQAPTPNSPDKT